MSNRRLLNVCLSAAWGGQEMVAYDLAMRLPLKGIDVITACPKVSRIHDGLTNANRKVWPVELTHRYLSWTALSQLRALIRSHRPDAVLLHQLSDLWQVVPAQMGYNLPIVGIAHSTVGVNKKDFVHRWLYSHLTQLVALTPRNKLNLIEHLPVREDRIQILPNSVDTQAFSPMHRNADLRQKHLSGEDTFWIGLVTRIDPAKGVFEAIEAARQLKLNGVKFKLSVVGQETANQRGTTDKLKEMIQTYDLTKEVELLGHRDNIAELMASFDTLLMPSPAETFGRVLIEAMASRLGIVACAGGGVPDLVEHNKNGLLVAPGDSAQMAAELKKLAQDPSLRERLATEGLKRARTQFDREILDHKLIQIIGL